MEQQPKLQKKYLIPIGLAAGLINGLFGAGGGLVLVAALIALNKLERHCAHATSVCVICALTVVSIVVYFFNSAVPLRTAWPVCVGAALGGWLGGRLLTKIPGKWLGRVFCAFMLYAGIRMLF